MPPAADRPVLHLTVGLPGVGKTTLARRLAAASGILRLTPDEWMAPLFGDSRGGGARDVLEGRMLWVADQVLRSGASVVVDFGCWSPEERWAVRALAEAAGAEFVMHVLELDEAERRRRCDRRWETTPQETFAMSADDQDAFVAMVRLPDERELHGPLPPAPTPHPSWAAWAQDRWPTLTLPPD